MGEEASETVPEFDSWWESCHDGCPALKHQATVNRPLMSSNSGRPGGTLDNRPVIHCREMKLVPKLTAIPRSALDGIHRDGERKAELKLGHYD